MPFNRLADRKIREAMANGEFDGLGARGPINLEDYFKLPPELRLAYSILKNAGIAPEEVEHLKEVDRLQTECDMAPEAERAPLARKLADAKLRLNLALDRNRKARSSP